MNKLEVGKQYPGNYRQEGIKLDYNSEFTLYIFLPNITEKESQGFRKGKYKLGLTEIENILFFTSEFSGAIDMSDSPFHFGLYKDNRIENLPKKVEDREGLALNLIVVDSYTGVVKALRLIGLSHEFSKKLIEICTKQSKQIVDKNKYVITLSRIQRAYSSSDIYSIAEIKCEG